MTDSLTVFGTDYTGVTGIKATGTGNGTLTYIRPQGNLAITQNTASGSTLDVAQYATATVNVPSSMFVVTLSWDDDYFGEDGGAWVPDCTFLEISSAVQGGKELAVRVDPSFFSYGVVADGTFNDNYGHFIYTVFWEDLGNAEKFEYQMNSSNVISNNRDAVLVIPNLETVSRTYTPTTSQQTDTITYNSNNGYNGIEQVNVTVNAMPSGSVTAPSTISGSSATVSTGTNTLTLSKTVSVTPSVTTAGYVSSGTAGNASVSLTASVNTRSSSDLTVSGGTVTAPAGYYASSASKSVTFSTIYTSTSNPSGGSNGDVWLKTVS